MMRDENWVRSDEKKKKNKKTKQPLNFQLEIRLNKSGTLFREIYTKLLYSSFQFH